MPFGLRNAAQTFQRFIDEVLRGLHFSYAYIDYVLIASATPEEHRCHLRLVLERFQKHGIVINPSQVQVWRRGTGVSWLYSEQAWYQTTFLL